MPGLGGGQGGLGAEGRGGPADGDGVALKVVQGVRADGAHEGPATKGGRRCDGQGGPFFLKKVKPTKTANRKICEKCVNRIINIYHHLSRFTKFIGKVRGGETQKSYKNHK